MKSIIKLAALAAIALNAHADTIVSVDPLFSGAPKVGSTITLDVDLNSDSESVAGFDFSVLFPPELLQATDVTEQGFFSAQGCCFGFSIDDENGVISGVSDFVFGSATDITSPDTLVSLQFQAVASGKASIELTCAQGDIFPCPVYPILFDTDFNSIPVNLDFSEVTITADSATTTPEPKTAGPILLALLLTGLGSWRRRRMLPQNTLPALNN